MDIGKSVDELTDFCKNLSRQEAIGELSSVSSGSDAEGDITDALTKPFNNPFQLKDRAPIVLNIKVCNMFCPFCYNFLIAFI